MSIDVGTVIEVAVGIMVLFGGGYLNSRFKVVSNDVQAAKDSFNIVEQNLKNDIKALEKNLDKEIDRRQSLHDDVIKLILTNNNRDQTEELKKLVPALMMELKQSREHNESILEFVKQQAIKNNA